MILRIAGLEFDGGVQGGDGIGPSEVLSARVRVGGLQKRVGDRNG